MLSVKKGIKMKTLMKNSMSIKEFYLDLPKLHKKFQDEIENLSESYCSEEHNIGRTRHIMVFAQRDCIDSIVNINALKCLETEKSLNIRISIDKEMFFQYCPGRKTPFIIGMDREYTKLWEWERVPQIISAIEKSSNQVDIIIKKKDYRYGKYLTNTINEFLDQMYTTDKKSNS